MFGLLHYLWGEWTKSPEFQVLIVGIDNAGMQAKLYCMVS